MSLSTLPYKGARDFYPEDMRRQKWMFKRIRSIVEKYGYEEYTAPQIEPIELYTAKTSEEIVNDQTYNFEDRGGRKVVIRPEMTPSVSRMVAARRNELAYPVRLYNIGNRMRYERQQRGRLREFWQLDVDVFGVDNLLAEVEIIQVADSILQAFGAKRDMYTVRINSRVLISHILGDWLGLDQVEQKTISQLIDRMHKLPNPEFVGLIEASIAPSLREQGASEKLLNILKVKNLEDLPIELLETAGAKQIAKIMRLLKAVGISNAEFDITLMRGFDYYTDIVFEVFDLNPDNNRAMFGGGRYDGLVGSFGVEPVPTVGFAMGDVTLLNFLESHQLLPALKPETDMYVAIIGDVAERAQQVVKDLRDMDVNLAVDLTGRKPDKQLKAALKKGIKYVLFVGEQELETEQYKLKNLATSTEESHSLQRIVSIVKDRRR